MSKQPETHPIAKLLDALVVEQRPELPAEVVDGVLRDLTTEEQGCNPRVRAGGQDRARD